MRYAIKRERKRKFTLHEIYRTMCSTITDGTGTIQFKLSDQASEDSSECELLILKVALFQRRQSHLIGLGIPETLNTGFGPLLLLRRHTGRAELVACTVTHYDNLVRHSLVWLARWRGQKTDGIVHRGSSTKANNPGD